MVSPLGPNDCICFILPYLEAMPAARITRVGCITLILDLGAKIIIVLKATTMNDWNLEYDIDLSEAITSAIEPFGDIQIDILRLDAIHPVISGNKWFKLKYHIEEARKKSFSSLITFGGAYSNHIVATAFTARESGLKSTGIIRGERPAELSPTLKDAEYYGMQLMYTPRYLYNDTEQLLSLMDMDISDTYIVNEGGKGTQGVMGAEEILNLADKSNYSHIACAVGTGTMLSGIINAALPHQEIIGISSLKGDDTLTASIRKFTKASSAYFNILFDYHFGGYAKKTPELIDFMNEFYLKTNIPTDFVYTGKLIYGIFDLLKKGYFPGKSRILIIHSGGLQGNRSLTPGTLTF